MNRLFATLFAVVTALPLGALDIRVHPGQNAVYVFEVDGRRGLATAMLHNLAVVQPAGGAARLEEVTIELRAGERVRQTIRFDREDLAKAAARMVSLEKAGVLAMYDFAFQRSRYLPQGTKLAASENLEAGSALIMTAIPLLLPRGVDSARIVAKGTSADGAAVDASLPVPLKAYEQKNDYGFPVRGTSVAVVSAGLSEPHRWALNEEFALDIVRVGASGKTCRGDCTKLADYYGWGSDVVAAADGVVVSVVADQKESAEQFRRPNESAESYMQRTRAAQDELLARGPAGVTGNLVVIRHAGGEFSHSAHLAEGSVVVKSGDTVKKGQKIGKMGHSGNSTEPHLHFGVADGPDPLYSRSLPVRFTGITTVDGPLPATYVQSGWLVDAK